MLYIIHVCLHKWHSISFLFFFRYIQFTFSSSMLSPSSSLYVIDLPIFCPQVFNEGWHFTPFYGRSPSSCLSSSQRGGHSFTVRRSWFRLSPPAAATSYAVAQGMMRPRVNAGVFSVKGVHASHDARSSRRNDKFLINQRARGRNIAGDIEYIPRW